MNLWLFYAEHLLCERGKKSWSNKRTESTKTVLGSSIRKFFDIVELELDNESMPVSKFSFGKKKDYKRRGFVGIGKLLVEWFCHWKKDKVRKTEAFFGWISPRINCRSSFSSA